MKQSKELLMLGTTKHTFILVCFCAILFLLSCQKKAAPLPLGFDQGYAENEIVVPYQEIGGVRTIQVRINDCAEFPMIFDTGCSGLLISSAEAYILAKQGCISTKDIKGYEMSTIADGSIVQNMVIVLHEIRIGDLVTYNVEASVSDNLEAPLLLGNGVLNQVKEFTTDNYNKTIIFRLQ